MASVTEMLYLSVVQLSPAPAGCFIESGGSVPDAPAAEALHLRNSVASCWFSPISVCATLQRGLILP